MKKIIVVLFVLFASDIFGQVEISAGMGIDGISSKLFDHVNSYAYRNERVTGLITGANFYGEADYELSNSYQAGIEYAFSMFSRDVSGPSGSYKLSADMHKPSLMFYYIVKGSGYKFKFGGGAGPRFLQVEETLPGFLFPVKFTSTGFGFMLKAEGITALGENLYADLSLLLNYDLPGSLKAEDKNSPFLNRQLESADTDMFMAGVRLGFAYAF